MEWLGLRVCPWLDLSRTKIFTFRCVALTLSFWLLSNPGFVPEVPAVSSKLLLLPPLTSYLLHLHLPLVMSAGNRSHRLLTEKLATCIQYIKSKGFRSFPDFMKQLFIEFSKGSGGVTDGPHQTVMQTLRSFLDWGSLKPVLDGIAESSMMGKDENRDGVVPDHCVSPDISIMPGSPIVPASLPPVSCMDIKVIIQKNSNLTLSAVESSYSLRCRLFFRRSTRKLMP